MIFPAPGEGRLFRRAVLMSGVLGPGTAPGTRGEADEFYEAFCEKVGVKKSGEEGLEELRQMDVQRIVDVTREVAEEGTMFRMVRDEAWMGVGYEGLSWERLAERVGACEWVEEIVMGVTGFEVRLTYHDESSPKCCVMRDANRYACVQGTFFMSRVAGMTPKEWISSLTQQLGPQSAELLCKAYKVTPEMDHNLFTSSALRWVGDCIFDGNYSISISFPPPLSFPQALHPI